MTKKSTPALLKQPPPNSPVARTHRVQLAHPVSAKSRSYLKNCAVAKVTASSEIGSQPSTFPNLVTSHQACSSGTFGPLRPPHDHRCWCLLCTSSLACIQALPARPAPGVQLKHKIPCTFFASPRVTAPHTTYGLHSACRCDSSSTNALPLHDPHTKSLAEDALLSTNNPAPQTITLLHVSPPAMLLYSSTPSYSVQIFSTQTAPRGIATLSGWRGRRSRFDKQDANVCKG